LAQYALSWESPQLLRPGSPAGLTIMAIDYGLDPFGGLGAAMVYRSKMAPGGFGLRVSAAHGPGEQLAFAGGNVNIAGGIDASSPLLRASPQFPLDVIWTWGVGGSYGEHIQIALPVGVAAARAVSASAARRFNPYASARAVLEGRVGSDVLDDEATLGLAIDVGTDLVLGESRDFVVQLAVSLGDRHAAAIGFHLGGGTAVTSTRTPAPRRR
jgi:hypothetical protein